MIGGPGHTVQIDKCLLVCKKYNVGHLVDEQWVFGGYDVVDKVGFMVPVDRRNNFRYLGCLQYAWQARLPASYSHHTYNFVDPIIY